MPLAWSNKKRPPEERFWEKVKRSSPDECWVWTASTSRGGYGAFGLAPKNMVGAHRYSFYLANGYWPQQCRHTCDNPPCCNPAHLRDGNRRDNVRDMIDRGRAAFQQQETCAHGHAYSAENTYFIRGRRICKICTAESRRGYADRNPILGLTDPRHGTRAGYAAKCRCIRCRADNARRAREQRLMRKARRTEENQQCAS